MSMLLVLNAKQYLLPPRVPCHPPCHAALPSGAAIYTLPVSKDLRKSGSKTLRLSPEPLYDHEQMHCHVLDLSLLVSKMELDCP